jgi:hypothetical protein
MAQCSWMSLARSIPHHPPWLDVALALAMATSTDVMRGNLVCVTVQRRGFTSLCARVTGLTRRGAIEQIPSGYRDHAPRVSRGAASRSVRAPWRQQGHAVSYFGDKMVPGDGVEPPTLRFSISIDGRKRLNINELTGRPLQPVPYCSTRCVTAPRKSHASSRTPEPLFGLA